MQYFMCENCFTRFDSEDELLVKNYLHYCKECFFAPVKIKAIENFSKFENPF